MGTTASPAYRMNGVGTIGVVCHSVICVIDVRCAVLLCWECTDTLNTAKHLQQQKGLQLRCNSIQPVQHRRVDIRDLFFLLRVQHMDSRMSGR